MTRSQWRKLQDVRPEPLRIEVEPQSFRLRTVVAARSGSRLVKPIANITISRDAAESTTLMANALRYFGRN